VPLAIHRHVPAAPGVGQEGVVGEQEGSLRVRLQGVARGGGEGGRGMYHLWQKRIRCLLPGAKCRRGGPQQAGRGAGGGAVQCSACRRQPALSSEGCTIHHSAKALPWQFQKPRRRRRCARTRA
jgi:hypothetical protein